MWRIVFQVFPLVVWCVAILVVVKPLRFTRRTSLILSFVILAALSKFAFYAVVGGDGFSPDLPARLIWFCGWIYAAAILLTGFAFVCVLGDGVLRLCRHSVGLRTKRIRTAWRSSRAKVPTVRIEVPGEGANGGMFTTRDAQKLAVQLLDAICAAFNE